jgi:kynurenine formamidase
MELNVTDGLIYWLTSSGITVDDLEKVAKHQGITLRHGDILLIRTGFLKWYKGASVDKGTKAMDKLAFAGIKAGEDTERWLWNNRIAAVACDTVGLEGASWQFAGPAGKFH